MKARMSLKNIIFVTAIIILASMFFINICFATNNGKIIVDTAKLREQPNTEAKVLELISKGEEVKILEEQDGWYKIEYKQITGYLRTDLVETSNKTTKQETDINTTKEQNIQGADNLVNEVATETSVEPIKEEIEKGKQYKIVTNIKLKAIPLINALELDEIVKDTQVEIIEVLNDWAKIKTSEGKEGWTIKGNLASIQSTNEQPTVQTTEGLSQATTNSQETKKMYVNTQTVNVRAEASKTSQTVKQLALNTEVTVMTTVNGWAYVEVNGIKGYISESLLSSAKKETSRSSTTERENTKTEPKTPVANNTVSTPVTSVPSANGIAVVAYAQQFLGASYKYGGTTPSGFDCSGFTQYVYKNFGVTLSRTAAGQYGNGTAVTDLQPGDLLMFGKSSINHVGIYIGGNQFIHAANPSKGVRIDSVSSSYYKSNYRGARRIF